jgi:hypothetical protein
LEKKSLEPGKRTRWALYRERGVDLYLLKNGLFEKKTSEPGEKGTAFLDGNNSSPQQNQQDPKLTKSSGQS